MEEHDVVLPDALALRRRDGLFESETVAPGLPSGFDFVVAAPEHDAGVIAQTLDLLRSFFANVLLKCQVARHHVAAEHELLPDHQAQFVAEIVEVVALVNAAAPLAHHVHVSVARGLENLPLLRGRDPAGKAVKGDDVRAFGEYRNAVHDESEAGAPLVRRAAQFEGAQAGLQRSSCDGDFVDQHPCLDDIAILSAVAGRVPEPWRSDAHRQLNEIGSAVERELRVLPRKRRLPRRTCDPQSDGCGLGFARFNFDICDQLC